jgi:hypothetical protein
VTGPSILPIVPFRSWVGVASLLAIAATVWAFLSGAGFTSDLVHWGFAVLAGALFVSFGFSVWSLAVVAPRMQRPSWLDRRQGVALAAACFLVQSALAGILSIFGAWPHPKLWFLGALPFLWRG